MSQVLIIKNCFSYIFCLHTVLSPLLPQPRGSFWWDKTFRYGRQKLLTFPLTNLGLLDDFLTWSSKVKTIYHLGQYLCTFL